MILKNIRHFYTEQFIYCNSHDTLVSYIINRENSRKKWMNYLRNCKLYFWKNKDKESMAFNN